MSETPTGQVWIVGAGPGDPGLLTVKALQAITNAEVVLYDRLVSPEILALVPTHVNTIDVGKDHGEQITGQERIMALLLTHGTTKRTVRLKGGDPFVFGRGAEEWQHLKTHGIPVVVIPGVSSSLAVPALAGIPLTHRDVARGFAVVTGHRSEHQPNWQDYARIETLVILMGVGARQQIALALLDAGRDPHEACAFIERGSTPRERVVVSTLENVALGAVDVENPATWVIGEVVRVREMLMGD